MFSFFTVEFLTFEVVNNGDGEWSFPEGSHVTLVCTYRPYRGIHRFVFNSRIVSACTGTLCTTLDNDQGGFSFKHDTDSGIFTWTINTVYLKYNNMSFVCIDVEDEIEQIATVTVKGEFQSSKIMHIQYDLTIKQSHICDDFLDFV